MVKTTTDRGQRWMGTVTTVVNIPQMYIEKLSDNPHSSNHSKCSRVNTIVCKTWSYTLFNRKLDFFYRLLFEKIKSPRFGQR